MLRKISEETLLPVSFVIILFGFVSWLTSLYSETKAHGSDIAEIRESQRSYNQKIDRILEQLGVVQGILRNKHDNQSDH